MIDVTTANQGKSGRPFVFTETEKPCAQCQRVFTMAEAGVKFPSHFADVRYCSAECKKASRVLSLDDLLARSQVDPDTGCFVWTGRRNPKGYGRLLRDGKETVAHRAVYEAAKGPIPDGLVVMHSCDNPPCINPDHLSIGTVRDNWHDAISKGRAKPFGQSTISPREPSVSPISGSDE